jgi:predicted MFS family arabinose efflux permease
MCSNAAPLARGLVSTLTLATFVNHLNVIAWNPFLPFIAQAHGLAIALLGQVPALMMLVSTFLGLVIGPLADRYGHRRTLLVCLLAVVTSSLATGLAVELPVLVLAALLGAVGRAAIMPVAQAIVAASFVDETARRRAVSRIQSGGPLAATLGIPLLTAIAAALQWRSAFYSAVWAGAGDHAHPLEDTPPGRDGGQRAGPPEEHIDRLPATHSASLEPDLDRRRLLREYRRQRNVDLLRGLLRAAVRV